MSTIRILHNIHEDASFGLNTVLDIHAPKGQMKRQIPSSHPLVVVFSYEYYPIDSDTPERVCDEAYRMFNIGTAGGLAKDYRARKLRSFSVGDVVAIDDKYYACETADWHECKPDELQIVAGDEADQLIHQHYDFGDEELCIPVPLNQEA